MEEINLGQISQQNSTMNHIKELGKLMKDAHTKSLVDLTVLAKTKNISLPTSQTENGEDANITLNDKSGNIFGKEYSGLLVYRQKNAIALFEKASTNCTDPDLKAWATATLLALRPHLDQ